MFNPAIHCRHTGAIVYNTGAQYGDHKQSHWNVYALWTTEKDCAIMVGWKAKTFQKVGTFHFN